MKKSRSGKWRALCLLLVNVVIAGRLAWWLANDQPAMVSPVEPSESLAFSKDNIVNAGLIFFLLMIVSTMVFGRFFCGWACHFLALQDGARWLLLKVGIRPKPFRSRLLALVPVGAFLYMFIWPLAYRGWLLAQNVRKRMAAGDDFSDALAWANTQPFAFADPTNELVRAGFWDTFPGLAVAIFSFLVAGMFIVYVLGSKGFCFYACPYGGIFGPVDRLSPFRIRVNEDCTQSGHCTSVCSSNVRVHEEVRDYGMVVDSGCMKCLDCVSVCPNEALRWGPGRPALFAKPRRTPDIRHPKDYTLREEFALAGVFLVSLYAVHGLYGVFPFLVSLGVASILAYILVSVARMAYMPTVRAARMNLRLKGRVTRAGYASIAVAGVLALFLGHSTLIQHRQWRGSSAYDELASARNAAIASGGAALDERTRAELASNRSYIERTMALTPFPIARHEVQQAWLSAALGEGERFTDEALEAGSMLRSPTPFYMDVARTNARLGQREEAEDAYEHALEHVRAGERAGTLAEFAEFLSQDPSRASDALASAQAAYESDPSSVPAVMALAQLRAIVEGDRDGSAELIASYESGGDLAPEGLSSMVSALFELGAGDRALPLVRRVGGAVESPGRAALTEAEVLMAQGDSDGARAALSRVLDEAGVTMPVLRGVAEIQATRLGDYESALATLDRAIETGRARHDVMALKGDLLAAMGRSDEAMAWYERALARVDVERKTFPQRGSLWSDTGGIYARMGRFEEAASALERATEFDPRNPGTWAVLANVYTENGEDEKAGDARARARALQGDRGSGPR